MAATVKCNKDGDMESLTADNSELTSSRSVQSIGMQSIDSWDTNWDSSDESEIETGGCKVAEKEQNVGKCGLCHDHEDQKACTTDSQVDSNDVKHRQSDKDQACDTVVQGSPRVEHKGNSHLDTEKCAKIVSQSKSKKATLQQRRAEHREECSDHEKAKRILEDFIDNANKSSTLNHSRNRRQTGCIQLGRYAPEIKTERSHSDSDVGRLTLRITQHSQSEDSEITSHGSNNSQQPSPDPQELNLTYIDIAREMALNGEQIDHDFFNDPWDLDGLPMELIEPQPLPVPAIPAFPMGEYSIRERTLYLWVLVGWQPDYVKSVGFVRHV